MHYFWNFIIFSFHLFFYELLLINLFMYVLKLQTKVKTTLKNNKCSLPLVIF